MKFSLIAATALVAGASATDMSFGEFMKVHGKKYASKEELVLRRSVFAANAAKVAAHNAEGHSWSMKLNKFADLTGEEFKLRYTGGLRAHEQRSRNVDLSLAIPSALPAEVDWESKGAVTPVKNQGQCGSCYSFSGTGSIEGINFIKTGKLISVSEQQIVDCSGPEGNQGCDGGLMDYVFEYVIKNGGICGETEYKYTGVQGTCKTGCTKEVTITGFTDVPANSETALQTAIAQQPVSVAVEADQNSFQFYSGGVMTAACGTALDHGVLAVGYGTLSGVDYYKVKNSWGADWGSEGGYILLGRGDQYNGSSGQCGIQSQPSYPTKN